MTSPTEPTVSRCKECGAPLSTNATGGLCLRCALDHALEASESGDRAVAASDELAPRPSSLSPRAVRYFGDYELLEEIGRGGMGVVHKARQVSLNRFVAVKMLLSGELASKEFVQRFRSEASAAALLQHPNIVAIHEVGVHDGQHYFSMDYVEGPSLGKLVAQQPLPARRAASYVKTIAEAIHYAHERGVLHRDLKPSNVLIDPFDQPRVTDFGLAKRFGVTPSGGAAAPEPAELVTPSDLTITGQVLGSPNYMPPEQAAAKRGKVGKPSDVYSLGAILYHVLTGRPPFVGESLTDTLHQVLNAEPVSPRLLIPSVPRDLETICVKCLEKEPGKRYTTAQALAYELNRFLNDEPIHARPVSTPEKFWRWCRRKPIVASLGAATLALLLAVAVGAPIAALRISAARQAEAKERRRAEGGLYAAQMKLAHAAFQAGKIGGTLELLRAQPPGFRGFEWRFLYRLCQSSQSEVLATNTSGFSSAEYSPDRRTVAFGTGEGAVEIFDFKTRQRVKRWQAHDGAIDDLAFHPQNANWLATASGDDGLLKLWDVARERVLLSTNSSKGIWANLAFSPSGRFLVSGAPDAQSLNLWELRPIAVDATPKLLLKTNLAFLGPAAFSPDERSVVLGNPNGALAEVALYELASGHVVAFPISHANLIACIAFSRDGSKLASGGADERVVLWDPRNRVPIHTNATELINVTALTFAPDSQTLFASGWDQNIRFWHLGNPSKTLTLKGHSAGVNAIAMSPDGSSLASGGRDGSARLWKLRMEDSAFMAQPPDEFSTLLRSEDTASPDHRQLPMISAAVSPDQVKVAAFTAENLIVCDLVTGARLATVAATNVFRAKPTRLRSVTFSPDGGKLAVGSEDGKAAFLDTITLQPLKDPIQLHQGQITDIAFCLNGTVLATGGGFGTGVSLTEVASGRIIRSFSAVEGLFPIQAIAVSRDGRLLATGSPQHVVSLWDIASGQLLASHSQKVRFLHCVTFSPDSKLLAFTDELGAIFLWELGGQRPLRKLVGHAGPVNALTFSPDGRTLASGSMDHTIKLWHSEIEQEVATLEGHSAWIWCVLFAQHGDTLVSGSQDGSLKLWRALSIEGIEAKEKDGHIGR